MKNHKKLGYEITTLSCLVSLIMAILSPCSSVQTSEGAILAAAFRLPPRLSGWHYDALVFVLVNAAKKMFDMTPQDIIKPLNMEIFSSYA